MGWVPYRLAQCFSASSEDFCSMKLDSEECFSMVPKIYEFLLYEIC